MQNKKLLILCLLLVFFYAEVTATDKSLEITNLELNSIKKLLSEGYDINYALPKQENNTLLHLAVINNNLELVQFLISHNARLDLINSSHESPLLLAIKNNNPAIVELFLKKQNVNEKIYYLKHGNSLLHIVCELNLSDMVRLLLKYGANPNAENNYYLTPIFYAINKKNLASIKLLVENNANIYYRRNNTFPNPIQHAAQYGNMEIMRYFMDEKKGDSTIVDGYNRNLIYYATLNKDLSLVPYLLSKKVSPYAKDSYDSPPILNLLRKPYSEEKLKILELLIEGQEESLKNKKQTTLLHTAAYNGNNAMIEYFLQKAIPINAKDNEGETPLFYAIRGGYFNDYSGRQEELLDSVEILIKQGADIHLKNKRGENPLSLAYAYKKINVADYLLKKGGDLFNKNNSNENMIQIVTRTCDVKSFQFLFERGVPLDGVNTWDGNTALHDSILYNCPALTRLLVEKGANINKKNKAGETPLFMAMRSDLSLIQFLLEKKADPSLADNKGMRPLDIFNKIYGHHGNNAALNQIESLLRIPGINLEKKLVCHTEKLSISANPGLAEKIVGYLSAGDEIAETLEETKFTNELIINNIQYNTTWLKIKTKKGLIGWVYRGGLKKAIVVSRAIKSPVKHIQDAIEKAERGDMILIKKGTYQEEFIINNKEDLLFSAEKGAKLHFKPKYMTGVYHVTIKNSKNIELRNFNIKNITKNTKEYQLTPLLLIENSQNLTIVNSHMEEAQTGIEIKNSEQIKILNNQIDNCYEGIKISATKNLVIEKNVIFNASISVYSANDLIVKNNTIVKSSTTAFSSHYASITLHNNIFAFNKSSFYFVSKDKIKGSHNLVYNPLSDQEKLFEDDISANPQFIDIFNNDYRLQSSSPAINAGLNKENIGTLSVANRMGTKQYLLLYKIILDESCASRNCDGDEPPLYGTLYPIGFSKDSKFAYIYMPRTSYACQQDSFLVILDLKLQKTIYHKRTCDLDWYNSADKEEVKEFLTLLEKNAVIQPKNFSVQQPPVKFKGKKYKILTEKKFYTHSKYFSEISFSTSVNKNETMILAQIRLGTDDDPITEIERMFGYLKSPFEKLTILIYPIIQIDPYILLIGVRWN